MPNNESWERLSDEERGQIGRLVEVTPPGAAKGAWYRVLRQEEMPDVFSPILKKKCDHAVLMVSDVVTTSDVYGTFAASTVVVCNAQRVDAQASAIDQEPFAISIIGAEPAPSGMFLHHGNWAGRTRTDLDEHFWQCVEESGVGNIFPFRDLPGGAAGALSDLRDTSLGRAFRESVNRLRARGSEREET